MPDADAAGSCDPTGRGSGRDTAGADYAERLQRLAGARWKQVLDVQRPYRWNLHRLELGRCLDIGCGIGRNLAGLAPGSVGVDHNADAIAVCRERGLTAYTTEDLAARDDIAPGSFDALLLAHVLEHVDADVGDAILRDYLPYLRPHGRVVLITPQEVGMASDPTHIRWVDHAAAMGHLNRLGLVVEKAYSFPLPRVAGRVFRYNEFVTVAHLP